MTPVITWAGCKLYVGRLYVGYVVSMRPWRDTWRAAVITGEDGGSIGDDFQSDVDARLALEREALRLILEAR